MKRVCLIILTCLFISAISIHLHAFGIGGSITGGGGERFWTKDIAKFSNGDKNLQIGGGLVLDSNMARLKLFNYRLTACYNKMYGDTQDLSFINTYHSFGFGLVKKKYVRLWMGPQIGVGYGYGDAEKTTFMGMFMRDSFNYKALNASLGLVVGVNINLGKYILNNNRRRRTVQFFGRNNKVFRDCIWIRSDCSNTSGKIRLRSYKPRARRFRQSGRNGTHK